MEIQKHLLKIIDFERRQVEIEVEDEHELQRILRNVKQRTYFSRQVSPVSAFKSDRSGKIIEAVNDSEFRHALEKLNGSYKVKDPVHSPFLRQFTNKLAYT